MQCLPGIYEGFNTYLFLKMEGVSSCLLHLFTSLRAFQLPPTSAQCFTRKKAEEELPHVAMRKTWREETIHDFYKYEDHWAWG